MSATARPVCASARARASPSSWKIRARPERRRGGPTAGARVQQAPITRTVTADSALVAGFVLKSQTLFTGQVRVGRDGVGSAHDRVGAVALDDRAVLGWGGGDYVGSRRANVCQNRHRWGGRGCERKSKGDNLSGGHV